MFLMLQNQTNLVQVVVDVIHSHPQGLNHAQLVQSILKTGYRHFGNLSADVMKTVQSLRKQGVIEKNLETRVIVPVEHELAYC